jgi:hypothetical protein
MASKFYFYSYYEQRSRKVVRPVRVVYRKRAGFPIYSEWKRARQEVLV